MHCRFLTAAVKRTHSACCGKLDKNKLTGCAAKIDEWEALPVETRKANWRTLKAHGGNIGGIKTTCHDINNGEFKDDVFAEA